MCWMPRKQGRALSTLDFLKAVHFLQWYKVSVGQSQGTCSSSLATTFSHEDRNNPHRQVCALSDSVQIFFQRARSVILDDAVSNSFKFPPGKDKTAFNFLTVPTVRVGSSASNLPSTWLLLWDQSCLHGLEACEDMMRVRHQREAGLSVHFPRECFLHATHCHGQLAFAE